VIAVEPKPAASVLLVRPSTPVALERHAAESVKSTGVRELGRP